MSERRNVFLNPDVRQYDKSQTKNSQVIYSSTADYSTVRLASTAKLTQCQVLFAKKNKFYK